MATTIPLAAQLRDASMTPKALRRAQIVPGVVYGRAFEALSVQFDYLSLARVARQAGTSRLISVEIEGQKKAQDAFLREVQRDPVSGRVLHVDLYAVVADEKVRNLVPLVQRGRAPAVELGAVIVQSLNRIEIECLPGDMPASIVVDLSQLTDIGSHLTVADLVIPEKVAVLQDPASEVANAVAPRMALVEEALVEEVEVPVEVEGEQEAEAEPAEESARGES